jgi:uncharacterized membrane protein HdeD (DUF308 family)
MYYQRLHEGAEEIHQNWGWFLALGISLTILGFVALGAVFWTTLVSMMSLGWLVLLSGAFEVLASFGSSKWSGFLMNLFAGILYMVIGGMVLANPFASASVATLLLAALFFIGGLFRTIGAAALQHPRWGWAVFDGVVTMLLGALIWAQWPSSALWLIGTWVGINFIFRGCSWMMLGLAARRLPLTEGPVDQPQKREPAKRF